MKFSAEVIVAAAVAVVFGLLSLGAIAREQGEPASSASNHQIATSAAHLSHGDVGANDIFGVY